MTMYKKKIGHYSTVRQRKQKHLMNEIFKPSFAKQFQTHVSQSLYAIYRLTSEIAENSQTTINNKI